MPGTDVGIRGRVGVDEARARRGDVERRRGPIADGLLDEDGRGGHRVVGRQRGDDDDVDVVGLEAGDRDGALRGDRRQRGGRLVGRRDAPLADARCASGSTRRTCPRAARGRRCVRTRSGTYEPQPRDAHAAGRRRHRAPSPLMRASRRLDLDEGVWRALTRAPSPAARRRTVPVTSLLISLKSFIASMRPMTWPAFTGPPSRT